MSSPFVGEIRMFGGSFAPAGWAFCSGQLMPISENETLFQLIGTTFGGDGQETFALPNLQGRIPIHMGTGPGLSTRTIGEMAGSETVTLTVNQIPSHNHTILATANEGNSPETGNFIAAGQEKPVYGNADPDTPLNTSVQVTGGNQPHENMMPSLCVSYIISLYGVFPSQN